MFGAALPVAERYAGLLAGPAVERGLLGPREVPRLWNRHIINCGAVAELIPRPCALVDIGSGAGLPGIVLALLLGDVQVTLLEPMARRALFLTECIAALGLPNTAVRQGRAEDLAGAIAADVATARAVAPMTRLGPMALALVRPGGLVLAIKGDGAFEEIGQARPALKQAGATEISVVQAGSGRVSQPTIVVQMTAGTRADSAVRRGRTGGARSRSGRRAAR